MKNCTICGTEFKQYKSTQRVCSYECAIEFAKLKRHKDELKAWSKRKKQLKEQLKTTTDLIKETQIKVNEYIRLRDHGRPCVSCLKPFQSDFQAGHFYSAGKSWAIRFDPRNIHGQCIECNMHLNGNGNLYRKNITKRISKRDLKELDALAHTTANFSRHDLEKIKTEYVEKIADLKNK